MLVKYYEGIRLNKAGDGACLYNDGNSGCWDLTSTGKGNCTVGWGHELHEGPCNADDAAEYPDGADFGTAERFLSDDIQKNAIGPLNHCVTVPLSQGELAAIVSLLFNIGKGPVESSKSHWAKDKKTGKSTFVCVPGPVAELLNSGNYDGVLGYLRDPLRRTEKSTGKVLEGLRSRREQEVHDWTNGEDGEPRPAKWAILAGVLATGGAVGTVRVSTVPARLSFVCATNEKGIKKHRPCGYFFINEEVKIVASSQDPRSRFVGWKSTDTARDLCAGQPKTCTVHVRDQLVRAIAIFARSPAPKKPCSGSGPAVGSRYQPGTCGEGPTTTTTVPTEPGYPSAPPNNQPGECVSTVYVSSVGEDLPNGDIGEGQVSQDPDDSASFGSDSLVGVSGEGAFQWPCATEVTLHAGALYGSHFVTWGSEDGMCSGVAESCTFSAPKTIFGELLWVKAEFARTFYHLSVDNERPADGSVRNFEGYEDPAIDCGNSNAPGDDSGGYPSVCDALGEAQSTPGDYAQVLLMVGQQFYVQGSGWEYYAPEASGCDHLENDDADWGSQSLNGDPVVLCDLYFSADSKVSVDWEVYDEQSGSGEAPAVAQAFREGAGLGPGGAAP